ncbi:hypothetical protein AHF37_08254 [Paragonimus kellicotti]|nr:hypothetical protein AHF37_08254 [Paragonimus kellicotti]
MGDVVLHCADYNKTTHVVSVTSATHGMPAIGIDLGTTNCCVSVYLNDEPEVIPNDQGNRTTPSYVAYTPNGTLVGEAAKAQQSLNPKNTIYDSKRLIGRFITEESVKQDCQIWPFRVVGDDLNRPLVKVTYKDRAKTWLPEQISAVLLRYLKVMTEAYMQSSVTEAIVTVPAYFHQNQRSATKLACELAGFDVLEILDEPTAAAIAYSLEEACGNTDEKIMVVDFGGGTLDISVLEVKGRNFYVKGTTGDTHLGGQDIDQLLVRHLMEEIKTRYNVDLTPDDHAATILCLRAKCEECKRTLTNNLEAEVSVEDLFQGIDFRYTFTRALFEQLTAVVYDRLMQQVQKALDQTGLTSADVNRVLLVGGSTRIPKVQELLRNCFGSDRLCRTVNPDEAVAQGAAIYANRIDSEGEPIALQNDNPYSLGLKNKRSGLMDVIIKRGTQLPTKELRTLLTTVDCQKYIKLIILEGEHALADRNKVLGEFSTEPLQPAPAGQVSVDLTFQLDEHNILTVLATERGTSKERQHVVTNTNQCFSEEELKRIRKEAEEYEEDERSHRERLQVWTDVDRMCFELKKLALCNKQDKKLSEHDFKSVVEKCEEITAWLLEHQGESKEVFENKKHELEEMKRKVSIESNDRY